jgi:hypothetical protein
MYRRTANHKASFVVLGAILVLTLASCNANSAQLPTSTEVVDFGNEVKRMEVVVQVSADVADALYRRGPPTSKSEELLRIIETVGLSLEPMHYETDDPTLRRYFIVEVDDQATAQRVIDSLQQSEAVEAVYVKPPDELP